MKNWAGNRTYRAARIHEPATVEQLQSVVTGAARVRALGSRHSFNALADTTGDLVSVAGIAARVDIDDVRRQATVSAGMRYAAVTPVLQSRGWALPTLASLPHISVAGAIATATHGSGDRTRCLAASVAGLTLVTAEGSLVTVGRDDPDFAGWVVSLGALGVVTAVTLDLVPAFEMAQWVYDDLPLEGFVEHFEEVLSAAYSVSAFTNWRAPAHMQVWRKQLADEPAPPASWLGARLADAPRHPIGGLPGVNCTPQLGEPGPWHERLPHFRAQFTPSSGAEIQSEWLVPRSVATAAIGVIASVADAVAPVLQTCEIRSIAGDDLWLSPAYGRDSVGLHFTWRADTEAVLPVVSLLEDLLAQFDARPHWGKLFSLAGAGSRFPRGGDFAELRGRVDPHGKFGNEFLADAFPL